MKTTKDGGVYDGTGEFRTKSSGITICEAENNAMFNNELTLVFDDTGTNIVMRDGKNGPSIISYNATNPAPECPHEVPYTIAPTMSPTASATEEEEDDDAYYMNGRCDEDFCMCTVTVPYDEINEDNFDCPAWMYGIAERFGTDSIDGTSGILVCSAYNEDAFNEQLIIGYSPGATPLDAKVGDNYIVKYDENNPAPECPKDAPFTFSPTSSPTFLRGDASGATSNGLLGVMAAIITVGTIMMV